MHVHSAFHNIKVLHVHTKGWSSSQQPTYLVRFVREFLPDISIFHGKSTFCHIQGESARLENIFLGFMLILKHCLFPRSYFLNSPLSPFYFANLMYVLLLWGKCVSLLKLDLGLRCIMLSVKHCVAGEEKSVGQGYSNLALEANSTADFRSYPLIRDWFRPGTTDEWNL